MTTYRAVVKYPVDATDKEKLRALREGLQEIAMEMVGEHDTPLDAVEAALDDALSAAEDEWNALHEVTG